MIATSLITRPLTEEEINQILQRYFPCHILWQAVPMAGGMFNNTVRLDFTDIPSVVLRAGPINREPLLPFELHLMAVETEVDRLCEQNGIPCAHVLATDTSKTLLNRDFMLVDYIDSVPLSSPAVPTEIKPMLHRETGCLMKKFHQICAEGFGRVWDVTSGNGASCWSKALLKDLDNISNALLHAGLMESGLLDGIRRIFVDNAPLFDTVHVPHLVHADLWEGNILVRQNDGVWSVAAIIDADRAFFGDPDYDFATPWMTTPDFLAGYENPVSDTPARQKSCGSTACCAT